MLVERAEDDRYHLAVGAFEVIGKIRKPVEPLLELNIGLAPVLEDLGSHFPAGIVPRISPCERVVDMHAGCQDHSPVVCLHHAFASELICSNGRRVVMTVIHDFSKIETVDRRIVAADCLGVRAAFNTIPVTPVHQIVMMSEHPTCLLDSPEIGIQGLGLVGGVLVHHAQCHRTGGFTAFGKPGLRLAACAEGQSQRHN